MNKVLQHITIVCDVAPLSPPSLSLVNLPTCPHVPVACYLLDPASPPPARPTDDGYDARSTTQRYLSLSSPRGVRPPPLAPPHDRSFFTGNITLVPDKCIYRTIFLKLVRFSYAYVLSLCLCDYFSRKLLAKFEFPYLKARYVLFFHRKEFRRKSNGAVVEFLNRFAAPISLNVAFQYNFPLKVLHFLFGSTFISVLYFYFYWHFIVSCLRKLCSKIKTVNLRYLLRNLTVI